MFVNINSRNLRKSAVLIGLIAFATPVFADLIEYTEDGTIYLNGAPAQEIDGVVVPIRLQQSGENATTSATPAPAEPQPSTSGPWNRQRITQEATRLARRYDIPTDLFLALIQQESGFQTDIVSPKGAYGLTQLMPGTARELGVNPRDPAQNLEGGARYLSTQYRRFGSWRLALAAYNAGPHRVEQYSGVPPYRETRNYVRIILSKVENQS